MKKIYAEILAGMIPRKMARNRWRGLLRFGIFRLLKLKKELRHNHSEPNIYLAVCTIARNEGPYLKEWIDWHLSKGVEKFYFYDNESTDNTREILEPYIKSGVVDYKFWKGNKQQLAVYDDCIEKHRYEARWIAFIDLDEFIVPLNHKDIKEFLKDKEKFSSIEINWLLYGSGGQKEYSPLPVMDRFKHHSQPSMYLNRHVKSIVNPRKVAAMIGAHEAARITGRSGDSHGNIIKKGFRDREPQHDVIKINHYAVKSWEEFMNKHNKGSVRTAKLRGLDYFNSHDLNDIKEE